MSRCKASTGGRTGQVIRARARVRVQVQEQEGREEAPAGSRAEGGGQRTEGRLAKEGRQGAGGCTAKTVQLVISAVQVWEVWGAAVRQALGRHMRWRRVRLPLGNLLSSRLVIVKPRSWRMLGDRSRVMQLWQ